MVNINVNQAYKFEYLGIVKNDDGIGDIEIRRLIGIAIMHSKS